MACSGPYFLSRPHSRAIAELRETDPTRAAGAEQRFPMRQRNQLRESFHETTHPLDSHPHLP